MEIAILVWIICGIAAAVTASNRGASGCLWFGLGVLFGPFGLAFSFMAGNNRKCPACRKNIDEQATKYPYCQSDVSGGAKVVVPVPIKLCRARSGSIPAGASFCVYCGKGQ